MRRCSFVASFRINTDVDRKCQTIIFSRGKKIGSGSRSHVTVVENLEKVSYSISWLREIREFSEFLRCNQALLDSLAMIKMIRFFMIFTHCVAMQCYYTHLCDIYYPMETFFVKRGISRWFEPFWLLLLTSLTLYC